MVDRTPTEEQQKAIDLFAGGSTDLVIQAGAGTGKTTTLGMMARSTWRHGSYLAFNRSTAADAARAMPMTVEARTVHSIAAGALRRHEAYSRLLDRLGGGRMAPSKVARLLKLGPIIVEVPAAGRTRTKVLQPSWQGSHVLRAVRAFCHSGDRHPSRHHFPFVDGIDPPGDDGKRSTINNRLVARELESALHAAWADLCHPGGELRWTHDVYLKLAQLNDAPIPGDFLLFDEAQDASPVMLAWVTQQQRPTIYVGDSQQSIYEWRGAINAMAQVGDDVPTAFLTQSWRFGPAIADVANLVLDRLSAELRLTGTDTIRSVVHTAGYAPTPRAVLCRSNSAAVQSVLTYQEQGLQPHLVGGAEEIVRFAHAAAKLQAGERTGHPELACFETWREVVEYVENDPQGSELRMLVGLLDKYGVQIVVDALDGLMAEDGADVIISTAHKAKGREWPSVRLTSDFEPGRDGGLSDAEWRLLYVAATRAEEHLDLRACEPLRDLLEPA